MSNAKLWAQVAQRAVEALNVQPGELIQVRERTGRVEVWQAVMLAIEATGATPAVEITSAQCLLRMLKEAPLEYLAHWDKHRLAWMEQYDRIVTLGGAPPNFENIPAERVQTWLQGTHRLTAREEARRLPFLVMAIPTAEGAEQMGWTLAALEAHLLPALAATVAELRKEIAPVLSAVEGQTFTIRSGNGHLLTLQRGDRIWHVDDGLIDDEDWVHGAFVGNLPAGAIYTTVVEAEADGTLWLPIAGDAKDVTFHFERGRIAAIEAASRNEELNALFDGHSGEPRRVSHIGIGLNPYLHEPIGWTLVDEHIHGNLLIALGENRYMGGQNESSLNVDFVIPQSDFVVDGRTVVQQGQIVI